MKVPDGISISNANVDASYTMSSSTSHYMA
jgi:hypothetical protein